MNSSAVQDNALFISRDTLENKLSFNTLSVGEDDELVRTGTVKHVTSHGACYFVAAFLAAIPNGATFQASASDAQISPGLLFEYGFLNGVQLPSAVR